uniref:Small EDRK-rich factor-like N-terminal domain-containing protein n=1 Tax=Romanomermis culicivorax TaxID=13658 RepID=A0A915JM81_ROMCU
MSNAQALADKLERGETDLEKEVKTGGGGSGKNRSKVEQHEHKKANVDDTRRIVANATNAEQKRREEEKQKNQ